MDIAEKMAADIALAIDGGDWQDAKWFSKFHREAWIKAVQPYADEIERLREALKQYRDGHYSGYVTLPCGWDDEGTLASYALKGFDVATYVNDCEKAYAKLKEDE